MKSADVKLSAYSDFGAKNNDKDLKFEVNDHIRVSKRKKFFCRIKLEIALRKFL